MAAIDRRNFIRLVAGSTLSADEILRAKRLYIKIVRPDGVSSTERAVIELPPARKWEGRDLTIIDTTGQSFRLVSHGDEVLYGDGNKCGAVRLVPLLSDRDDEPDGWGLA
jgi:hypothetical protein